MTFWQFLNQWWNLPYVVMLGLVGVFFALQAFGLASHAVAGEHDLDLDGDGVPDAPDADHDLDHDHDAGAGGLASLFGVGRVPFMVIWLTLFIFAGFTGIFVNRVLQVKAGQYPAWGLPLSLLVSLATGVVSVRFTARGIHKLVDTGGRGSSRRSELTGSIGTVASPRLDATFGEVRVRDPRGNELIVHGHLAEGDGATPLRQGARVVLVELKHSGFFTVAALEE